MTTKPLNLGNLSELMDAVKAEIRKSVRKIEGEPDPAPISGRSAEAMFAAGVRAGIEATRHRKRASGQKSMDRGGLDSYVPGIADVTEDPPSAILGDRAVAHFRSKNAHTARLRQSALNHALIVQGSDSRTTTQKAEAAAVEDGLRTSSLRAVSGAQLARKAESAAITESVMDAVSAAGSKGVDYGRLCLGLGISEEQLNVALADLRAAGRIQ